MAFSLSNVEILILTLQSNVLLFKTRLFFWQGCEFRRLVRHIRQMTRFNFYSILTLQQYNLQDAVRHSEKHRVPLEGLHCCVGNLELRGNIEKKFYRSHFSAYEI